MTPFRLLLRNLFYHWRGNLAVFLGVAVGAAVLTGALLVGDSLRGSLRDLTLRRLGWVDDALIGGRFIREQAVEGLPAKDVSPAILVRGTASLGADGEPVRQVNVIGVTEAFWKPAGATADAGFWNSDESEVVLGKALADALKARPGERVRFRVGKFSDIPPESLLGRRNESAVTAVVEAKVRVVLDADAFGSRFNLAPTTEAPRNAFVPLKTLQKALGQEGRVNAVFAGGDSGDVGDIGALQAQFSKNLKLDDWGLTVQSSKAHEDFLTLESRQLMIEPAVASAALAAAKDANLTPGPTLVYLVDTLAHGKEEAPYVVVAALDPAAPPPLGPFLPPGVSALKDDEIVLADWKGSPITAKPGDTITLSYYPPEEHGEAKLLTHEFKLAGTIPMSGPADDPGLTPEFPGVTDKVSIRQWDPPPPFDPARIEARIKPNDVSEQFWKAHRATPRAYVNLAAGQKLWGSRFGELTSIRLAPKDGGDLEKSKAAFETALLAHLKPDQAGLVVPAGQGAVAQGQQRQHRLRRRYSSASASS